MKKRLLYIVLFISLFMVNCNAVLADNNFANYGEGKVSCGNGAISNIPSMLPKTVSVVYIALQIAVPVLLVIFGSIDLVKAITSGKEDEIKRNQNTLIRRVITGVLVFFVFALVKVLVNAFGDNASKVTQCMNCFLNYNGEKAGVCDVSKK